MRSAFVFVMLLSACTPKPDTVDPSYDTYACDAVQSEKLSAFILKCIESANPKSDEEPEDWIELCQKMGRETLCSVMPQYHWRLGNGYRPAAPCSRAMHPMEKAACPEPWRSMITPYQGERQP